jgi:hypothetical protein
VKDYHSRPLLTLLLTVVLALTVLSSAVSVPATRALAGAAVPLPGVSIYNEDFTTTTYRDAGATGAHGWGTGSVTSPRTYSVQLLSHHTTSFPVRALDIQDHKAYIVLFRSDSSSDTIEALDLSNLYAIQRLSYRDSSLGILSARVDGDILYAGMGLYTTERINVYNVSNPYDLGGSVYLNSIYVDNLTTDMDVQGHFLYATVYAPPGPYSFIVVDVEDPAAPVRIPNPAGYSQLLGLDVDGPLAYLADGSYGLYIQNVSTPASAAIVGHVDTPGNATDVLVDGHFAFVADGFGGVQIIDVSHPDTPIIVGSYNTPGNAQRLALQGKTLFVADGAGGLQVLDVAVPSRPAYVTSVSLPYTYDVHLYGGDVIVAAQDGVYAYRIGYRVASLPFVAAYAGYQAWDVRVRGDIAYVAAGSNGLVTLNVSDPAHPVLLDQDVYGSAPFYRKLDVQGTFVYIANYNAGPEYHGLIIYDASDPANLRRLDTTGLTYPTDVAVAGDVAWVADGTYGVYCFNVSNPYSISTIDFWGSLGNVTALWVQGYHLYVVSDYAGSDYGFRIYDIRTISSPTLVMQRMRVSYHYDIFVDGDIALLADRTYMTLYNVTNPFVPSLTDEIYNASLNWLGVWGFGPYVLQVGAPGGVALVNATDGGNLRICATYAGAIAATQVTVRGDYVYVANRTSLVILRLFESAGATFSTTGANAQSLTVDATSESIVNATLSRVAFLPISTGITWQLSADGGAHWEAVTPDVMHTFTNIGSDLRWRATFTTSRDDQSAHLYGVSITYGHTVITTSLLPIPGFPIAAIAVGAALSLGLVLVLRQRKQRKQ